MTRTDFSISASANISKRRRLSRRERKNLKKQKISHSASAPPPPLPNPDHATTPDCAEIVDYLANYSPTPFSETLKATAKTSSLGKWFPKGRVLKPANPPPLNNNNNNYSETAKTKTTSTTETSLVLFYQYLPSSQLWSTSRVDELMDYLQCVFEHLNQGLGGRIRVAREGVNATISAISISPTMTAAHLIRHFAQDLIHFDPIFKETDFKFIDHLPADRHFKDMKILPVQELVFYGGGGTTQPGSQKPQAADSSTTAATDSADASNKDSGATHVDAVVFHKLMERDDAVVIDVRNHYEAAIGRFAPPSSSAGAASTATASNDDDKNSQQQQLQDKYIDPRMRKSTDWMSWVQQPSTQEQLRDKTVLMYCTGGIRCEKASVYLEQAVGNEVKGIYQLKGGIEKYMQQFASEGGGYWKGHNFVFDKREAVSSDQPQGVGGVYRKPEGKDASAKKQLLPTSYCCLCEKPWDRYLGKKKCDTCGVPVLMCETCLTHHSAKKKNTKTMQDQNDESASAKKKPLLARCPLCVEENITVPAALVEYTDNGKKAGKWVDPEGGGRSIVAVASVASATTTNQDQSTKKVAPSVLKWGGGHAAEKKVMRRLKRKLCRFGAECARKDCFFAHPEKTSV